MKKTIIILQLFTIFIFSCSNPNEEIISYWENNNPKEIHSNLSNKGNTYTYILKNKNGKIITKGKIENGKQNGEWKWWYNNGIIKDIAYLNNGKYTNKRIHFNEKGDTNLIEIISKPCYGTCCLGKVIYFENNRRFLIIPQNEEGIKNGICFQLNEQADTIAIFEYVNNLKQGTRIEFFDNGNVSVIGKYQDDKENGKWILFYENGNPKIIDTYKNGEIINSSTEEITSIEFILKEDYESKLEYYQKITR